MNLYCLDKSNIGNYKIWLDIVHEFGAIGLFDKKSGWSSFDVVAKLKNLTGIKKIGHCGSLDPLATGLLILCFGKATKHAGELMNERKHYRGIIKFGAVTETDDREGDEREVECEEWNIESDDFIIRKLDNIRRNFIGKIKQVPPLYSAKKVKGKRLYKLARESRLKNNKLPTKNGMGIKESINGNDNKIPITELNEIEIKAVEVEVYNIEFKNFTKPFLEIEVECAKGTYIRSLARDIGSESGYGGYLYDLRRLAIGEFSVQNALQIEELEKIVSKFKI